MDGKIAYIREHLDRVADGEHEVGNLCLAMGALVDLVQELYLNRDEDDGFRDPRAKYDDLRSFDQQWSEDDLEAYAASQCDDSEDVAQHAWQWRVLCDALGFGYAIHPSEIVKRIEVYAKALDSIDRAGMIARNTERISENF